MKKSTPNPTNKKKTNSSKKREHSLSYLMHIFFLKKFFWEGRGQNNLVSGKEGHNKVCVGEGGIITVSTVL